MAASTGTFRVTLLKSGIGFDKTQKDTLRGLGLLRRHRVVELKDTPSARGMVYKVRHLVKVLEGVAKKPTAFKGAIVVPGPRREPKSKKAAKESKSKGKKAAKSAKSAKK